MDFNTVCELLGTACENLKKMQSVLPDVAQINCSWRCQMQVC